MRWLRTLAVTSVLVLRPTVAVACDPDWDRCGYEWYEPSSYEPPAYEEPPLTWTWSEPVNGPAPVSYEPAPASYEPPPSYLYDPAPVYEPPAPVYEPPVYEGPVAYAPIPEPAPPAPAAPWSEPFAWSAPGSDVLDGSSPPVAAPALPVAGPTPEELRARYGLHDVTEVWAGNIVTTTGLVTTYSTASLALNAGTAAKLVASVATGEASSYDAVVSTGRMALSDGRLVKGDVYASYVWNGNDYVFDRYVFFQDDLEIARLASPPAPTAPAAPVAPVTAPPPPIASLAPMTLTVPRQRLAIPVGPAFVTPIFEDPAMTILPPSGPATAPSMPRIIVAGMALGPQADVLDRIEVLRGRRIALWIRATVDGVPARVVAWRLVFGEVTTLGPTSGTGDEPLVATWPKVAAAAVAFPVRVRATVEVPAEGLREADATIEVVVRSPALVDP